jgi:hypothetical protein
MAVAGGRFTRGTDPLSLGMEGSSIARRTLDSVALLRFLIQLGSHAAHVFCSAKLNHVARPVSTFRRKGAERTTKGTHT